MYGSRGTTRWRAGYWRRVRTSGRVAKVYTGDLLTRNPKPRFALELAAVKPALSARFFHSDFYVANL